MATVIAILSLRLTSGERNMRQAIRIVIIIGNLFVASWAISANWYPIQGVNDEETVYVDRGSMKRQGDKITYWIFLTFKKPQEWQGKQYFSRMSYHTSDCKERTFGVTQLVTYDKEGKVVFSFDYPLEMKPVIPDSRGESILDYICTLKEEYWYPVYENDKATTYIDTGNMKIQGDKRNYWEKLVFKKPQPFPYTYPEGATFVTEMAYVTADCKGRTEGNTIITIYDKDGNSIYTHGPQLVMKPVDPDTVGELILDTVCAQGEKK